MSTIAVLTSNETGANSMVDINNNYANLNADKQEKAVGAVTSNIAVFGASNVLQDSGRIVPTSAIVGISDTQTLTNKTLSGNTSSSFINGAGTFNMNSSGVITTPNATDTLVGRATTDTLTNKTLSGNTSTNFINGAGVFNTNSSGTITVPSATDTLVGRSTTDTLTNKTITTPTITKPVMNATNPTAQTYTPAAAGTATLDLSLSNQHYITMPAGNITIALSNDTNNQVFYVTITQDGVGSRTVTWFTTIKWAGGAVPILTTTASKRDAFIFVRTGTGTYDGFIVGQNI